MTVHWTDELRQKIVPRRGHGAADADAKMPRKKLLDEVALAASEKPGPGSDANGVTYRWATLRRALVAAPAADYEAALGAARKLWPTLSDVLPRCALAYAFPEEADWANVAAEGVLAQIKKQKGKIAPYEAGVGMLGAVASVDLQSGIARAAAAKRMALYALTEQVATMVDLTGAASAPSIGALLEKAPSNEHKRDYAAALALIESDEAARALAGALSAKIVLPIAREYFTAHPAIAKKALAAVAKGSSTSAPIAAQLLRELA